MNKLAIITGASAGIGVEFARQLAHQQYDLLLVARRDDRLQAVADELQTAFGISAAIYPTDLADSAQTTALCDHIRTLSKVTLLINNAGFGTEKTIVKEPVEGQLAMMHVHMTATYLLTQAVLSTMIAHKAGGIINVSSIAAYFHGAGAVNYCATKAYLNSFSQSLQLEVAKHGINVQALCPGYTVTEFHDTQQMTRFQRSQVPARMWDSAEFVVKTSLDALEGKQVIVIPGRKNQMLVRGSRMQFLGKIRRLVGRTRGKRKQK